MLKRHEFKTKMVDGHVTEGSNESH